MKTRRARGVSMKVHPNMYAEIERKRREFMKKNNLDRLTTVAFTGILANGYGLNGTKKTKPKKKR